MDRLNTISQLQAATLSPYSALLALAPIKARIDNGVLMLRADPDRPSTTYLNVAAFPATGLINTLYRAADTQLLYEWKDGAYVLTDDYAPVRLVAQDRRARPGRGPDAVLSVQLRERHLRRRRAEARDVYGGRSHHRCGAGAGDGSPDHHK